MFSPRSLLFLLLSTLCAAQAPPRSSYACLKGTSFLDHNAPIAKYWGKSFLGDNIAYIDLPDQQIVDVFYYRYTSLARHLFYAIPGTGYTVTEFIQPVGWSGDFHAIAAAGGHQIDEARWLRSQSIVEDFAECWTKGSCDSVSYTHDIQYAVAALANVTGHQDFLQNQLEGMVQMYGLWDGVFDSKVGLYYFTPLYDAQEYSLPGYVSNTSKANPDILFPGPDTFRPSLNAYMVANADAIVSVASAVGNAAIASKYSKISQNLRKAMFTNLWNSTQQFFVDNIRAGQPGAGQVTGREEVGFYPFRYGIGLEKKYTDSAVKQLFDSKGFKTEWFPTTLETRNKYFTPQKPGDTCCFWQGQNWPFSTSHTLETLAATYRNGGATADQYYQLLNNYARMQQKDGEPYIAECHYPENDGWSSDIANYSTHYQHSTFINHVVTGLVGVVPQADDTFNVSPIVPSNWTYHLLENIPYHGQLMTIVYDRDGTKYNAGKGLTIFSNGQKIYNGSGMKATVKLPNASSCTVDNLVNVAANPVGYLDVNSWPRASATYSADGYDPFKANDGHLWYDQLPDNRWTNVQESGNRTNDTLTLALQRPHDLQGVAIAIYADDDRPDGKCACPSKIVITDKTGKTLASTSKCSPNDLNVIQFNQKTTTDTININLFARSNRAVGVTEVQLWVPANTGPTYYAVDALLSTASGDRFDTANYPFIAFDAASKALPNGAVVQLNTTQSGLLFSGLNSTNGGSASPKLSYINKDKAAVSLKVTLNRVDMGTVKLPVTKGSSYASIALPNMNLAKGNNFIRLSGGGKGVSVESITMS